MDRRTYLGTIGSGLSVTLAGCSQLTGPSIENAGREAWSNRKTEDTVSGEIIRGDVTLTKNQYTAQGFYGIGAPTLGWQVGDVSGGSVDVWVVTESEFEAFEDGDKFRFVKSLSQRGVTAQAGAEDRVDGSDDWFVVFDNTGRESDADDRVEFRTGVGIGG